MSAKEMMLEILRGNGKRDALSLRAEAPNLTDTEIIDRELAVPAFDPKKDYSEWPAGSPVADDGQVWKLLQPYNASYFDGTPGTLRALWGLCHTKNPQKAKQWVDPYGTSGMYMTDECYKDESGKVYRCNRDNVVYDANAMPSYWNEVV